MAEPVAKNDVMKLRHLEITDFKAIDSLVLDFPQPRMSFDPDILVMGSKNGVLKVRIKMPLIPPFFMNYCKEFVSCLLVSPIMSAAWPKPCANTIWIHTF